MWASADIFRASQHAPKITPLSLFECGSDRTRVRVSDSDASADLLLDEILGFGVAALTIATTCATERPS
jgi:hypothetical protein